MTSYREQARERIRRTERGAAIDLRASYVYPDGHANVVFSDGANWPFESIDQMVEHLRDTLLDEMLNAASTPS